MVALHNQLRTALTELTMGCVYSYPLFSFQGSICFSAAKIILSNLHFLVKYYFLYLIRFCLLFFSTANDILSSIIQFVKHFFIFLCLFSLFMSADISISSVVPLVNVFLFKHSLLTNAYTLFPTAFVQRHLFIIHA